MTLVQLLFVDADDEPLRYHLVPEPPPAHLQALLDACDGKCWDTCGPADAAHIDALYEALLSLRVPEYRGHAIALPEGCVAVRVVTVRALAYGVGGAAMDTDRATARVGAHGGVADEGGDGHGGDDEDGVEARMRRLRLA